MRKLRAILVASVFVHTRSHDVWAGVRVKDKVSAWQFRQVVIMPKGRRK